MNDSVGSLLAAAGVLAGYTAFTGAVLASHRRRRLRTRAAAVAATDASGPAETIVTYASQTGFAAQLAEKTVAALRGAGVRVDLTALHELDVTRLTAARRALFIVSTTGEGDAPDTAAPFVRTVMARSAPLGTLSYAVLAPGDRTYARYCAFGHTLDAWLRRQGASPLFPLVDVDNGDPRALDLWRARLREVARGHGASAPGTSTDTDAASVDWAPPPYGRWRLVQRTLLNPGSPGAPAFHLALEPLDAAASTWRAGDIAQVGVPQADGALPLQREYSIASLPEAGRVELLVRQVRRSCGALGLGSGWLTSHAPVGAEVSLRVRENRSFHPPEDARPLILVGNGTGIAGLRAHLHARARAGHQRNWLLFGERTAQHDFFFRSEIEAWRDTGILERVDLAFSRDQTARRYVQHLVAAAAAEVRAWVSAGAAVYVCGSLQGMAAGVSEALTEALGAEALARLSEEGRYRRDVY